MQKDSQPPPATPEKAGKLTIRRIGSILPTVCLVVLLLFAALVGWLTFVGLPDWALRMVEDRAAHSGYNIRLGRVRLAPLQGLAVRIDDIELYTHQGDGTPLAKVEKATVALRWSSVFTGDYLPKQATATQVSLRLPVTDTPGEYLDVTSPHFAMQSRGRIINISEGVVNVEGVTIHIAGFIQLPEQEASAPEVEVEEPAPTDLAEPLALIQPHVNRIHREIKRQKWQTGEFPHIDVQPTLQNGQQEYHVQVTLPKLDIDEYHVRHATADIMATEDKVVLEKLSAETVMPDSRFRLQGSYAINRRTASFNLYTSAPVLHMAQRFAGEHIGNIFQHLKNTDGNTQDINLQGEMEFKEDYTPSHIKISGRINQKNIQIGDSKVDRLALAFSYKNGDFLLEKCDIDLPEGNMSLKAASLDGKGQAELNADVEADAVLKLISEFTESPVTLPEGVVLQGKTELHLNAELGAPPVISSSEKDWQDYVPNTTRVEGHICMNGLECSGYTLQRPRLEIKLEGVEQAGDKVPTGIAGLDVGFSAESITTPKKEDTPEVGVTGVQAELHGGKLEMDGLLTDTRKITLGTLHGTITSETVVRNTCKAEGIRFSLENAGELRLTDPLKTMLDHATAKLGIRSMEHRGCALGGAEITLAYSEENPTLADIDLKAKPPAGGTPVQISATLDWTRDSYLGLTDILLHEQDLSGFTAVLEHFEYDIPGLTLPECASLKGDLLYHTPSSGITRADFVLDTPKLVRTPQKVPGLAGQAVDFALQAKAHLFTRASSDLVYEAALTATHETGTLEALVQGSGKKLTVTGTNSIRPDIADRLVDDPDAHAILRDFKFSPETTTRATDVSVDVDLTNGTRVFFRCNADVGNFSYLFSAIEDAPDGTERVRTDMGEDPYSYLHRGTCSVQADLAYGCKDAQGNALPDVCTVLMGNIVLDFDNRPWLKRCKFPKGEASSKLLGDAVLIDIEQGYVEIRGVRGRVYPAYSLGTFYPDLERYMEDVIVPTPATLSTEKCVFPYGDDCPLPFSGTISTMCASRCELDFLGTRIPIEDFTGFIHLTHDAVLLDRMNGTCWDGVLDAVVKFIFVKGHVSVDGYATASCLNMQHIAAAYGSKQSDALCHGRIRFRGSSLDLVDLEAYGDVSIADGDLLTLGIFQPVGDLISDIPGYFAKLENMTAKAMGYKGDEDKVSKFLKATGKFVGSLGSKLDKYAYNVPFANHVIAYGLKNASATFQISRGHLRTKDLKATGMNLSVDADIDMDLDTLHLNGNIWPTMYSIPAIVLKPITFLSKYIIDIYLSGPINNLKWGFGVSSRLKGAPASATSKEAPAP